MQKELIIGLALCLMGCAAHDKTQKEQTPLRVQVTVISPQTVNSSSRYVGTIIPLHETPLCLQTTGRVTEIKCKDGDKVRKGQVLLRVDDTQARNAVNTAEAALRQAQDGYDRVKQVHAKGAVTDQKMVEVESQLARARSMCAAAQQQLNECTLTAPCNGIVSGLTIEIGQAVIPGIKVLSLLDQSALCVRFTVPEGEVRSIHVNAGHLTANGAVECTAVDTVLPISITEKSVTANPVTHTYEVTARVLGGTDVLLPGMVGKVTLDDTKTAHPKAAEKEHIIVPAHCIQLMPSGHTVWVVEQGRARRREITIGGYQAGGVLVQSGLHAGDTLITEGYQKIYNDCLVTE